MHPNEIKLLTELKNNDTLIRVMVRDGQKSSVKQLKVREFGASLIGSGDEIVDFIEQGKYVDVVRRFKIKDMEDNWFDGTNHFITFKNGIVPISKWTIFS